ncbi:MAG: Enolase, partial [uncultured bacterium]
MSKIKQIWSRQILDSRANPTVEVACILDSGSYVVASVPSGASTGTHEALELRDRDPNYYMGKGVLKAVENINTTLNTAVSGMDPSKQFEIDQKIIALDGTPNKTKLGANAILGVSLVVAKAAAVDQHMQPFRWIENLAKSLTIPTSVHLPTPIFNMING